MGYGDAVLNRGFVKAVEVSVDVQLEAVRQGLAGLHGRTPDGVILLGIDRTMRVVDAVACRLLNIDPAKALGMPLPESLRDLGELDEDDVLIEPGDGGQDTLFRRTQTEFGEAIGLWIGLETGYESDDWTSPGSADTLESLMSHATRDDLMAWLARILGRDVTDRRGAIALLQGENLALHAAWPVEAPLLLPLRFKASTSQAFRTARGTRGTPDTEPLVGDSVARVEPLVIAGRVIGLVAWEGDQPMVNRLIPYLPLALQRFDLD